VQTTHDAAQEVPFLNIPQLLKLDSILMFQALVVIPNLTTIRFPSEQSGCLE
jgi:hypothetical protein